MKNSKRKIIIGGIALLAYVPHVLTAALDSKPGDVSKAQFVVQLGADKKLTDAAADRTLTLEPRRAVQARADEPHAAAARHRDRCIHP